LATDLAPVESQPKVVGLMCVMQLVGMMGSALIAGASCLQDYSRGRLGRVVQAVAVLDPGAERDGPLWKQEARSRLREPGTPLELSFQQAWAIAFAMARNTLASFVGRGFGTPWLPHHGRCVAAGALSAVKFWA
jgi:BCD family chlorophyll transporter-like MFS transporter